MLLQSQFKSRLLFLIPVPSMVDRSNWVDWTQIVLGYVSISDRSGEQGQVFLRCRKERSMFQDWVKDCNWVKWMKFRSICMMDGTIAFELPWNQWMSQGVLTIKMNEELETRCIYGIREASNSFHVRLNGESHSSGIQRFVRFPPSLDSVSVYIASLWNMARYPLLIVLVSAVEHSEQFFKHWSCESLVHDRGVETGGGCISGNASRILMEVNVPPRLVCSAQCMKLVSWIMNRCWLWSGSRRTHLLNIKSDVNWKNYHHKFPIVYEILQNWLSCLCGTDLAYSSNRFPIRPRLSIRYQSGELIDSITSRTVISKTCCGALNFRSIDIFRNKTFIAGLTESTIQIPKIWASLYLVFIVTVKTHFRESLENQPAHFSNSYNHIIFMNLRFKWPSPTISLLSLYWINCHNHILHSNLFRHRILGSLNQEPIQAVNFRQKWTVNQSHSITPFQFWCWRAVLGAADSCAIPPHQSYGCVSSLFQRWFGQQVNFLHIEIRHKWRKNMLLRGSQPNSYEPSPPGFTVRYGETNS
jgi:hypothetical protein